MLTNGSQRWRDRRDSYRRPDEQIQTRRFDVALIENDKTAKSFVEQHHYSASYPVARRRFGLYESGSNDGDLVGVAVFSVPMNARSLNVFPGDHSLSAELGRFVLLDRVAGNGESWFLARCFELLRAKDWIGILSHSDPMPRLTADQKLIFPGHVGFCYQAHNAYYIGRSTARTMHLLPDGRVFSERCMSKIRAKEQGWQYSVNILRQFGASEPDPDNLRAWLGYWLPRLTRKVYHPGNYRYVWALQKKYRSKLPPHLKYPKVTVRVEEARKPL